MDSSGSLVLLSMAMAAALLTALLLGAPLIKMLSRIKFGQNINEDAPESHQKKQGTPSSGGILIVAAVTVGMVVSCLITLLWHRFGPPDFGFTPVYLVFLAHAGTGFLDDTLKARRGKSLGLKAREKVALQVIIAVAFAAWLASAFPGPARTSIAIWPHVQIDLGPIYFVFVVLFMIGMSNASNLTDGLDGLATGLSVTEAMAIGVTLLLVLHNQLVQSYNGYETLMTDVAAHSLGATLFCSALVGSCLGFLWFNAHPARVFMGDTGSLALGSAFAALAILNKIELPVLIISLVFLAEMASVVIQVGVFKATGGKPSGHRVFRMAPLHHHFELAGWPETQVVTRFCIVGVVAAVLGVTYASFLQGS